MNLSVPQKIALLSRLRMVEEEEKSFADTKKKEDFNLNTTLPLKSVILRVITQEEEKEYQKTVENVLKAVIEDTSGTLQEALYAFSENTLKEVEFFLDAKNEIHENTNPVTITPVERDLYKEAIEVN